jgi:hypothetical protein
MPPTAEDRLLDILEAIAEVEKMLAGYRLEKFTADKCVGWRLNAISKSYARGGEKTSRSHQTT